MVIEDEELRALFKAESEEYLQRLDEGLLRLESNPLDAAALDQLFRDAHNLKGAARMLGVLDIGRIAHQFETALGAAKRGEASLTSAMIDRMCGSLDGIRALVAEAITGEPSGLDVDQVIRQLEHHGEVIPAEPPADGADSELQPRQAGAYRIETIRVEPQKLDALMTQASELLVAKTRIAHRVAQTDELLRAWEEWSRHGQDRRPEKLGALLGQLKEDISEDSARLESSANRIDESVRAIRLMPLSTLFNMFPRMVRDIARERGKQVRIVIEGGRIEADKRTLEEMKDPLMHMIRNALDHGIETPAERAQDGKPSIATIRLAAARTGSNIVIEIADDGRGLNVDSIKATALARRVARQEDVDLMTAHDIQSLIFMPGFSTSSVITDVSGRGVGMDVVRTNVERLKGNISLESIPGAGCTFRVQLPATMATSHVLLVGIAGMTYGIPLECIHSTRPLGDDDLFMLEGRESTLIDGRPVSVIPLVAMLELRANDAPATRSGRQPRTSVVLMAGEDTLAVIVDDLEGEQEVILKPLTGILKRVRNVSGAAILATGTVCTVLNPLDLIRSARRGVTAVKAAPKAPEASLRPVVLLVEDSITTRTWEKRGLEAEGYEVVTAVDGIDALQKMNQHSIDAIVSDIEMPNMDGLTLTERIRRDKKHAELPIILVTSLATDADRKRGIEAGANAYITKSAFDQKLLVETIRRLT